MAEAMLMARSVEVRLPGQAGTVLALRDATLTVAEGECVALIGETGSGKSMLAQAVVGLLPAGAQARGEIGIAGRGDTLRMDEAALRSLRGRVIGFVPQGAGLALNPCQRAVAQVAEGFRRLRGQSPRQARASALALLERLGLDGRAARLYPHELSGGMRQRVLVAIGLSGEPRLLIADEPTKGMDSALRGEVVGLFREIRAARPDLALLVVTHDLAFAAAIADRVGVVYAGEVVEEAAAAAFFAAPAHPYPRALLAAAPERGMVPIPGAPPRLAAGEGRSAGCAFAPRCRAALPCCALQLPPDRIAGRDRVRCHHGRP